MSNSPLVTYTQISPNRTSPRNDVIRKITIHHTAGVIGLAALGGVFAPPERRASSNYGIDSNGNVGMYVEEKDRAWTSSSAANDNQAITIEVSNSTREPNWEVSEKAYNALIALCIDICKRNNIKELVYNGTKTGSLTTHDMFAKTLCPGPYLKARMGAIADAVNKGLNKAAAPGTPSAPPAGEQSSPLQQPSVSLTPITGESALDWHDLTEFLLKNNKEPRINIEPSALAKLFIAEGRIENIRGDIAFCQSLLETGHFRFGGQVLPEQNNYGGIGATDNSPIGAGAWFKSPADGVRAQIHHLKAYANKEPLNNPNLSPRFHLVQRGVAPYWEHLGQKENPQGRGWATAAGYGQKIITIYEAALKFSHTLFAQKQEPDTGINDNPFNSEIIAALVKRGVIHDRQYWEAVLEGRRVADPVHIRTVFDRLLNLL